MQPLRVRPRSCWRSGTAALRLIVVVAWLPIIGCMESQARPARQSHPARVAFRNVAESAGLDFVLENNPSPRKHLIETMAGGVAAFDYDGDGLTDIFFTNGASIPALQKERPGSATGCFVILAG